MLIREGKLSGQWFLITTSVIILIIIDLLPMKIHRLFSISNNFWWLLPIYFLTLCVYLSLHYTGFIFQVAIRSVFLAGVFTFGVFMVFYSSWEWSLFGLYMCIMSFFHYSEFLAIAWCNPSTLSISSFLLNHSTQYNVAAVASWIEFMLEIYLLPAFSVIVAVVIPI